MSNDSSILILFILGTTAIFLFGVLIMALILKYKHTTPPREVEFTHEMFLKLRDLLGKAPEIPCDEDEIL